MLYLYSEYLTEADPAIQVAAIRARGEWIGGVVDPLGNGRSLADGRKLIEMYRKLGLRLSAIDDPVESGILAMSQRMQSGRLKVCASLTKYLEERRLYRRDESDRVVKDRDHLQDAARCLVNGLSHMGVKPIPRRPPERPAQPGEPRVDGLMIWRLC